jgi:anti-sigma factor RsiW
MRCRAARRRLAEYVYNELSPKPRAALERHAAQCARCRGELEMTRRALAAMPEQMAPPLHDADREEMMRSVRRAVRTAAAARERVRRWAWSWAAGVLLAGALGAGLWYAQARGPAPHRLLTGRPPRLSPGALPERGSEVATGPGPSAETQPQVLAVADVEIEFVTRTKREPTVAPTPIGDDDVRMTP